MVYIIYILWSPSAARRSRSPPNRKTRLLKRIRIFLCFFFLRLPVRVMSKSVVRLFRPTLTHVVLVARRITYIIHFEKSRTNARVYGDHGRHARGRPDDGGTSFRPGSRHRCRFVERTTRRPSPGIQPFSKTCFARRAPNPRGRESADGEDAPTPRTKIHIFYIHIVWGLGDDKSDCSTVHALP